MNDLRRNLIEGLLILGKSVIWLSHRVNGTPFFRSDFCEKPRGGTEYLRERVKESKWQKPHLDTSHIGLSILGDGRSFQEKMVTLGPCIILFNSSSNHKRKPQRETRRAYEWKDFSCQGCGHVAKWSIVAHKTELFKSGVFVGDSLTKYYSGIRSQCTYEWSLPLNFLALPFLFVFLLPPDVFKSSFI